MESRQVRRLPVINAKKRMTGILSLGDLYNAVPGSVSKEAMQAVSGHHK
jgi:CBS domain-containing protein